MLIIESSYNFHSTPTYAIYNLEDQAIYVIEIEARE